MFYRGIYVQIAMSNHINIYRPRNMALVSPMPFPSGPTVMDVDPTVFAQVSETHLRHGAVPITHYLNDLLLSSLPSTSSSLPPQPPLAAHELEPTIPKAVAKIHQACQQTFGSTQAVKFDYEEDAITSGELTSCNQKAYCSSTVSNRKALYTDDHAA